MANQILMRSMNPPHNRRGRPWRGDPVARVHRMRYSIRFRMWSEKPLSEQWRERAAIVSQKLGHHFDYTNRWLILAAERMAAMLRR